MERYGFAIIITSSVCTFPPPASLNYAIAFIHDITSVDSLMTIKWDRKIFSINKLTMEFRNALTNQIPNSIPHGNKFIN